MKYLLLLLFTALFMLGCAHYGAPPAEETAPRFLQVGKKYKINFETGGTATCTILAKDNAGWYFVQYSTSYNLYKRLPDGSQTNVVETNSQKLWLNISHVFSVTEKVPITTGVTSLHFAIEAGPTGSNLRENGAAVAD